MNVDVRREYYRIFLIAIWTMVVWPEGVLAGTLSSSPTMGGDLISTVFNLYLNFRAVAWVVIGLLGVVGFMMWAVNKTVAIGALVSAIGLGIVGAFIEFTKAATGAS